MMHKVEGSGKLTVDVNAPAGTKVAAERERACLKPSRQTAGPNDAGGRRARGGL